MPTLPILTVDDVMIEIDRATRGESDADIITYLEGVIEECQSRKDKITNQPGE